MIEAREHCAIDYAQAVGYTAASLVSRVGAAMRPSVGFDAEQADAGS